MFEYYPEQLAETDAGSKSGSGVLKVVHNPISLVEKNAREQVVAAVWHAEREKRALKRKWRL